MTEAETSCAPPSTSSSSDIFPNSNDLNRPSSLSPLRATPTPPASPQHTTSSPASQDHTQQMSFTDYIEWYEAGGGRCHERVRTEDRNTSLSRK